MTFHTELIDTLWNVNMVKWEDEEPWLIELIDTLWNVNKTIKYYRQEGFYELIDTLWNVNSCKRLLDSWITD